MKHPTEAERERHRAEGHRAIGRYLEEFSQLVSVMHRNLADYLWKCGVPLDLSDAPFSVMAADALTAVYFEVARHTHKHDEKERRVAQKLKKAVLDVDASHVVPGPLR